MIPIKVRNKYMIGKVPGNPCKPRTNSKGETSMPAALHAQWLEVAANRIIHNAMKTKLAEADVELLDRKGGKVVGYITRKELSDLWSRK